MTPFPVLAVLATLTLAPMAQAATFKVTLTGTVEGLIVAGEPADFQPVAPGAPIQVSFLLTDEDVILRPFGANVLEYQGGVQNVVGSFGDLDFATTSVALTPLQEQQVFVRLVDESGGITDGTSVRDFVDTSAEIAGTDFARFTFSYDNTLPPEPELFDGLDLTPDKYTQDIFDLATYKSIGLRFEGVDGADYILRGDIHEITVSPIPLPNSAPLLAAGLAGVAALRTRKRRKQS